jgi:hypothetical protein
MDAADTEEATWKQQGIADDEYEDDDDATSNGSPSSINTRVCLHRHQDTRNGTFIRLYRIDGEHDEDDGDFVDAFQ